MIIWLLIIVLVMFGGVVFFGAPYVRTLRSDVRTVFAQLRPLTKHDVVVDLGSGDGVILKEASRYGAKVIGYELNPILVLVSRLRLRNAPNAKTHVANMWRTNLPDDVSVVYVFTVKRDAARLQRRLQKELERIGHSIDVISYGFPLPRMEPVQQFGGHLLYRFTPLQPEKAQV